MSPISALAWRLNGMAHERFPPIRNMIEPPDPSSSDIPERNLPKRTSRGRKAISEETLAKMRSEAERTAISAMRLMRGASDRPAGLTVQIIDSWLHGAVRSAVPAHVSYALNRWAALPTNRLMPLDSSMVATLAAEITRTGMGSFIFNRANDIPPGLTWPMIMTWINQPTRTVSEKYWEYISTRLSALPDLLAPSMPYRFKRITRPRKHHDQSTAGPSHRSMRTARQEISKSDLAELKHHRERTAIGGAVLLRTATDKPSKLTPSMISNWLSGVAKTANPEYVAYVLARYRAWP